MPDESYSDAGGMCILSRHDDKGGHWEVASRVPRSCAPSEGCYLVKQSEIW
jgi:hypothetical protein